MVKVGLVGLKDDRDRLLSVLHDLGVVQIEPIGKAALEHLEPEHASETARTVGDELIRFRGLKSALPPTPVAAPRLFPTLDELLKVAGTVTIDDEVGQIKREEDSQLTQLKSVTDELELLKRFRFYGEPLEFLSGKNIFSFFGEAKPEVYDRLRALLPQGSDVHFLESRTEKLVQFIGTVRVDEAEGVSRLAQQQGVLLTAAPRRTGRSNELIPALDAQRQSISARIEELRGRLTEISRQWYTLVLALEEGFSIENRKLEVWTRLGSGRTTFVLEGWVPKRSWPTLIQAIDLAVEKRAHLYEIPTDEEPPTLMDNPPGIRWYEFFIRFYSLPQAGEWDPTWVFAIVFPIFFGLMLGDWGYGFVILGFCLWMIRGFPGADALKRNRLTGGIVSFVKRIMGPNAMRQLAYALVPGTLIAIGLGFYFDAFFGTHPFGYFFGYVSPADPVTKISKLLLLTGFIGLAMVTLGFVLGALKEYYHHHVRGALGKVGGVVFAWSIAGVGLSMIYKAPYLIDFVPSLVVGAALLFVGEGPQLALMGLIEVVSHILSYTRLVGILLASAILALVINNVAWGMFHTGGPVAIVMVILGFVILLVGQVFNLILGVFEPGIQGARLIFVEHFSKYFSGNGRPFHPFSSSRTHTVAPFPNGGVK